MIDRSRVVIHVDPLVTLEEPTVGLALHRLHHAQEMPGTFHVQDQNIIPQSGRSFAVEIGLKVTHIGKGTTERLVLDLIKNIIGRRRPGAHQLDHRPILERHREVDVHVVVLIHPHRQRPGSGYPTAPSRRRNRSARSRWRWVRSSSKSGSKYCLKCHSHPNRSPDS